MSEREIQALVLVQNLVVLGARPPGFVRDIARGMLIAHQCTHDSVAIIVKTMVMAGPASMTLLLLLMMMMMMMLMLMMMMMMMMLMLMLMLMMMMMMRVPRRPSGRLRSRFRFTVPQRFEGRILED